MALLRKYSSVDLGGTGPLTGQAGALLTLLRGCLVTGYGAFPAAGWTEPIASAGNIAAFQQGAGSGFHILVNDNGPNVTATYKEAWVTGWETLAGIGAPVGSGTGQFPTPAQLLTSGHGVCRKSNTADAVGRDWLMFADDRTFYLFILTADTAGFYSMLFFGDIYSLSTVADPYACMIACRTNENSTANNLEGFGSMVTSVVGSALGGFYLARAWGGAPGSLPSSHQGDYGRAGGATYNGVVQYPNGPDNSMYVSPVWVNEPVSGQIRGRLRGLFHICHASASFSDGQTFVGAGDYAGKSFTIVKSLLSRTSGGACFIAVETSNTVET